MSFVKENELNKRSVAVLDYVRTPYYKSTSSCQYLSSDLLKSTLLALLEKNESCRNLVDEIIIACDHTSSHGSLLDDICLSLSLNNSVDSCLINGGNLSGAKALVKSYKNIKSNSIDISVVGGLDYSSDSVSLSLEDANKLLSKLGKAKSISSQINQIRKIIPELSRCSESAFLNIIRLDHIYACQQLAYEHGISREEQDYFSFQSYKKHHDSKGRFNSNHEIAPIVSAPPHFKICSEDQFVFDASNLSFFSKQPTLLKDTFSSITGRNSSFFTDGMSFCFLAERTRAKNLGYDASFCLADFEWKGSFHLQDKMFPFVSVIKKILCRNKLILNDIDVFEISESSAVGVLSALKVLQDKNFFKKHFSGDLPVGEIKEDKINIFGGGLSYGFPPISVIFYMMNNLKKALILTGGHLGLLVFRSNCGESIALLFQRIVD